MSLRWCCNVVCFKVSFFRCIVAGWGQNDANPGLSTVGPLKQVTMPIVDYMTCRTAHSSAASLGASVDMYLDPLGDICAGGESSKDACTVSTYLFHLFY